MTPLNRDGFDIAPGFLTGPECNELAKAIGQIVGDKGPSPGLRNLLQDCPIIREWALRDRMKTLVQSHSINEPFPVRALFFDKTEAANWRVPWHQDLTIAVARRIEIDGFGPWSIKAGVPHVQPPAAILEKMVTVRV